MFLIPDQALPVTRARPKVTHELARDVFPAVSLIRILVIIVNAAQQQRQTSLEAVGPGYAAAKAGRLQSHGEILPFPGVNGRINSTAFRGL